MTAHATVVALRREPGPLVRSLIALSLRAGLGLIFVMAGLAKFQAIKAGTYPAAIIDQFAHTPLKPELVRLFAFVLPYAEVGIGAALIAGVFTTLAATLSAVLIVHLLFGQTVLNNTAQYPGMLIYLLVNATILSLSPVTSNYLSVDGLLFGWFWAPRTEGTFRREESDRPGNRGS